MDSQRNLLLVAFILVSFLIWQTWIQDNNPPPVVAQQVVNTINSNSEVMDGSVVAHTRAKVITVKTDLLSLNINTHGGDVEDAWLLAYNATLNSTDPFELLEKSPSFSYIAKSGLNDANSYGGYGVDNLSRNNPRVVYSVAKEHFELADGQDELRVPMTYVAANNVTYTKTYILKRGQYVIDVKYSINNQSNNTFEVYMFGQLTQTVKLPKERETSSGSFAMNVYRGAAYSSDDSKYKKYTFSDMAEPLNILTEKGWVAMLQQYFATAWIPVQGVKSHFYTSVPDDKNIPEDKKIASIGFKTEPVFIKPQSTEVISAKLWIGPEIQSEMAAVADNLDLTVDYGWLWFLSQPLFKLLKFIEGFVGNWGVAIILITFIVRGIMYPLTKAQYTSMAKMKLLQPRIQAMRERLGDDKQRMSQEMMAIYKEEKVNPLGGCFPIIIQMPIFLSLFYMLSGSVELRHAPFALWLTDLSAQDPYYILPILMGGTMYLIQKMSPTAVADPMQQKIMTFMPVIFTVFFLWFPSGLVLYYIMSNMVTIVQQQLIYRGLEKRGLHTREKKK